MKHWRIALAFAVALVLTLAQTGLAQEAGIGAAVSQEAQGLKDATLEERTNFQGSVLDKVEGIVDPHAQPHIGRAGSESSNPLERKGYQAPQRDYHRPSLPGAGSFRGGGFRPGR